MGIETGPSFFWAPPLASFAGRMSFTFVLGVFDLAGFRRLTVFIFASSG
jgi:hypothetical protein